MGRSAIEPGARANGRLTGLDEPRRLRRKAKLDRRVGRTAGRDEPFAIPSHLGVATHPGSQTVEDFRRDRIHRLRDAVVNPFPVASRRDEAGASKGRKMARNLWLTLAERFDEKADADLVVADQVEQPKSRPVAKCLQEAFDVLDRCCHRC